MCGGPAHAFDRLQPNAYSYLLGQYLGDGHIVRMKKTYRLRIFTDVRHWLVIWEIKAALAAVMPDRHIGTVFPKRANMAIISSYSKSWPCLLPQHGPGRKHERVIELTPWQQSILDHASFVRGLIHSDGSRVLNRVNGKDYPRYFFTQKSEDIKGLFCASCEQLGVQYQADHPRHVSIARAASVARLDATGATKSVRDRLAVPMPGE